MLGVKSWTIREAEQPPKTSHIYEVSDQKKG